MKNRCPFFECSSSFRHVRIMKSFDGRKVHCYVGAAAPGWRVVGNVHVGGPEEVLQRDEKTRLQAATETDTETAGTYRFSNCLTSRLRCP